MNVILRNQQKHSDLAEFFHGCCCSPVPSTLITAIKIIIHYMAWFNSRIYKKASDTESRYDLRSSTSRVATSSEHKTT